MERKQVADYKKLLLAGRWFRDLPEAFQDALLAMARLREVSALESIFFRGEPANGICGVLQGQLRVSGGFVRGKETVLMMVEPPGWVGEVSLFDGAPRSHELRAEVDSLVAWVPADALLAYLEREPRYWRDLGKLLTAKLRLSFLAIEDASQPSRERVARRLVMIAEGYGQWTDRAYARVEVSQEMLATMLSTSRQTVNQVLRAFEAEGLVKLAYGGVIVHDREGLRRIAEERSEPRPVVEGSLRDRG
jgi:CRP-like cAMP-binding protein